MTIAQIVKKYQAEIAGIDAKIVELNERKAFVNLLLREIRQAEGSAKPKATRTRRKKAAPKAAKSTAARVPSSETAQKKPAPAKAAKKPRTKRSGISAKDAILKVVGDAAEAITVGEIIAGASALSGGKASSIRTQLGALTKAGALKQVPFSGLGFKYAVAK